MIVLTQCYSPHAANAAAASCGHFQSVYVQTLKEHYTESQKNQTPMKTSSRYCCYGNRAAGSKPIQKGFNVVNWQLNKVSLPKIIIKCCELAKLCHINRRSIEVRFFCDTVYIDIGYLNLYTLCSKKKHVTTFLMISWSRTVRLERFLAHLLLRVHGVDRCFYFTTSPISCSYFTLGNCQDLNISKN